MFMVIVRDIVPYQMSPRVQSTKYIYMCVILAQHESEDVSPKQARDGWSFSMARPNGTASERTLKWPHESSDT
jgi:hypothetical protein